MVWTWRAARYIVLGVAALVAVLGLSAASPGGTTREEQSIELVAFVQPDRPTHDGSNDAVLDAVSSAADGSMLITGWAVDTDEVEVLADGMVVGTLPIDQERVDVAVAQGLNGAFVGFSGVVEMPADTFLICVTRPGQLPGPLACNRETLDLERQRVVAFYGVPGTPALGTLGSGTASQARRRLLNQARPYEQPDRHVIPAFEVLGTVAQAAAGQDGNYSAPSSLPAIREYLEEIRKDEGIVVIDIQPGRDEFMDQLPAFEDILREPDVHVALDPEWRLRAGELPNQVVGHVGAGEVNAVIDYLDRIVREHRLPPKLLIVHNFQPQMIRNRPDIEPTDSVDLLIHMDGHGPPATKTGNYTRLVGLQDAAAGFKLFYQRDVPLMSPSDVFAMDPDVDFVSYQ